MKIIKIFSLVIGGILLAIYGGVGVYKYGFYISPGQNLGQLEGGVAPVFLVLGLMMIVYGGFEYIYSRDSSDNEITLKQKSDKTK